MKVKMHFKYLAILFLSAILNNPVYSLNSNDIPALSSAQKWFSAWEMLSRNIYKLKTYHPVEFVFFDDQFIYSTSVISVPDGEIIEGPSLFNKKFIWKRKEHNGKITLPDKQIVPVGLMSFASPMEGQKSFFVMPPLSFWQTAGVESKEIGIELLVTGVFLHEFSHTQQMQNFGKKMTTYEMNNKFAVNFSDDIVQDYFDKDSVYENKFREEVSLFYNAAVAADRSGFNNLTTQALQIYNARQANYFTENLKILKEIDDFFLTMEGIGQYSMYAWLIHPKGGNIATDIAVKAVRRGGRSWSQEEGLSLFLVLCKLIKPGRFAASMFGNEAVSVIDLIKKYMAARE